MGRAHYRGKRPAGDEPIEGTMSAMQRAVTGFYTKRGTPSHVTGTREDSSESGSSALNRGHEHHRSIRRCRVCEGRPRRFGAVQRGGGTWNANSSRTVQQWTVIPAAMAGVRLVPAVPVP